MLALITIIVTTLTTHNIEIMWMVHHIQMILVIQKNSPKNNKMQELKPKT
jgi:hypothetical protein